MPAHARPTKVAEETNQRAPGKETITFTKDMHLSAPRILCKTSTRNIREAIETQP